MNFKPAVWQPIATVLTLVNLVAVGFAAAAAQPLHAATHAGLAVAFGIWALRLKQAPVRGDLEERLDALEAEVDRMRGELSEAQERLNFAERVLAQAPDQRRMGPER
jgi:TolA-binding protein